MGIKSPKKDVNIKKNPIEDIKYPLFSFKYLEDDSIKDCDDSKFFFDFIIRLKKLSELGWDEIRKSARHSFGTEKIPKNKIKKSVFPKIVTPDVQYLTVFRTKGNNLPFVGIQEGIVFHILFIECEFGDIYDHN
jgi:hypothetical protein